MRDFKVYQIDEYLNNRDGHFFDRLNELIKEIGFDFCAYGVRPIYDINETPKLINNYANEWMSIYLENNYIEIDPIVTHAFHSNQPLIWSGNRFKEHPAFWSAAEAFDIKNGFSYPQRDLFGRIGVLTFSGDKLKAEEITHHIPLLCWISQIAHIELANLLIPVNEKKIHLTKKEKDVLRFTFEGKTTSEISSLMFISESGVNYHFANIFKKMSVKNKHQAVSKALVFNLLY